MNQELLSSYYHQTDLNGNVQQVCHQETIVHAYFYYAVQNDQNSDANQMI